MFQYIIQVIIIYLIANSLAIEVNTTSGRVRGNALNVLEQTVHEFLGIPYAQPPVNELRFGRPKPIDRPLPVSRMISDYDTFNIHGLHQGVIDGTRSKFACYQKPSPLLGLNLMSEDCLVLNIWTAESANNSLKPVMYWIHGGNLEFGTIFHPLYNGSVLATQGVVFVAPNYRVGKFGFLYGGDDSAPGNAGLYDQLLALEWVLLGSKYFILNQSWPRSTLGGGLGLNFSSGEFLADLPRGQP